jgi:site-specific DNA-methyltransferase (cytosine-N4-specific)
VLTLTPKQIPAPIGLVVTSPPYPNAYEYWLYHKYRMYWLGMDPIKVREREIGARPHYFKRNGHKAEDFRQQMACVFALLCQTMHQTGRACFLIGHSVIHGKHIDNLKLLIEAARQYDFMLQEKTERPIARTRKAFNLKHARIDREHIAVFCRKP